MKWCVGLALALGMAWTGAVHAGEKVVIKGSNTFGEFLGPQLIAEFRRENPGVEFEVETKGTASGIAALIAGECDLGAASRTISQDEWRLARSRGLRLNSFTIGYYGVAVIVNVANPVRSLTDKQIRDLFTGATTHWETGGTVQLYIRDKSSGTHLGFQELAMAVKPYAASARAFDNDADIAKAVATNPNGIGYVGMHLLKELGVHPVSVNGVPPTTLAVNEGFYPYARLILLYVNQAKVTPPTRQFLRFVQSRRGQAVLERHGYVPAAGRRLGTE
ncbi:MAG: Phosphate-binding protein PstS [Verrucomicrobiae bacterium]|nr:Phosphate-binding protein PstS [Verrucomicrobiae bacterium]